ncbi:MAG: hypothetical protein ACOZCL_11790 [Bacillota bacterium]
MKKYVLYLIIILLLISQIITLLYFNRKANIMYNKYMEQETVINKLTEEVNNKQTEASADKIKNTSNTSSLESIKKI